MSIQLVMGISSEGSTVAEAELGDSDPAEAVVAARQQGVDLLWLHTNRDLGDFGFTRKPGYVRMRAEEVASGQSLGELAAGDFLSTLDRAYRGLWGHKHASSEQTPPQGAVVLGLYDEDSHPIGLCTVFRKERLVDGPGVVPAARSPRHYLRLLEGACVLLGHGPIDLDSWGDDADVIRGYAGLGFKTVEESGGWEMELSRSQ